MRGYRTLSRLIWLPVCALILMAMQLGIWAFDRAPPFKVLRADPVIVKAGEPALFTASVWRDPDRICDADFVRYIFDSKGYRHDVGTIQRASAEMIARYERLTPGELKIVVPTPTFLPAGQASLVTVLNYACNPVHEIWRRITVTMEMPLTVVK